MSQSDRDLVSLVKAAEIIQVSQDTLRNWQKTGKLKSFKKEGKLFFSKKELMSLKKSDQKKLASRANKKQSKKRFIPKEYSLSKTNTQGIEDILKSLDDDIIKDHLEEILFVSTLLYLRDIGLLKTESFRSLDLSSFSSIKKTIKKENLIGEIKEWFESLNRDILNEIKEKIENISLEESDDLLGFLYQSLLPEGEKSELGSYYTPAQIVHDIRKDHITEKSKVLDPCAGAGQFLLSFSDTIKDPSLIYGFDIDPVAVKLSRLNLIVAYRDIEFQPNVYLKNSLIEKGGGLFDLVATNPPWGADKDMDQAIIKENYPGIESGETFSYFILAALDLLKDGGTLSFILPESFLNVSQHQDIRKIVLENYRLKEITYLDRAFSGVFSSVIRVDIEKKKPRKNSKVKIKKEKINHSIEQGRFLENKDLIIDIDLSQKESDLIEKIYSAPYFSLKNKADWALGIVTGDNKKFVVDKKTKKSEEPIIRGRDVEPFFLKKPSSYIDFKPSRFQQVADEDKYRAQEKIIYKFISDKLAFAYDDKKKLTLNSANIIIPEKKLSAKYLVAVLNHPIYQFIFKKKFNSVKVLKNQIESLPIPEMTPQEIKKIEDIVDDILKTKDRQHYQRIEKMIYDYFKLKSQEIEIIKKESE